MVMRIRKKLSEASMEKLHDEFSDLLKSGNFELGTALKPEANEEAIRHLPRLIFTPAQKSFGRLRLFIDAINEAETLD